MFTVCHKVISLVYSLLQYIIGNGILNAGLAPLVCTTHKVLCVLIRVCAFIRSNMVRPNKDNMCGSGYTLIKNRVGR